MEVDLDEEENCIFVSAIPKSVGRVAEKVVVAKADEAHEEVRRIVEHNIGELRPVNFEIHLAELVDGTVVAEDIHSEYIADEGLLRLELMGVAAIPQKRQQKFKKSLLGRLTSMFRRRGSGSKAQEGTKARKK